MIRNHAPLIPCILALSLGCGCSKSDSGPSSPAIAPAESQPSSNSTAPATESPLVLPNGEPIPGSAKSKCYTPDDCLAYRATLLRSLVSTWTKSESRLLDFFEWQSGPLSTETVRPLQSLSGSQSTFFVAWPRCIRSPSLWPGSLVRRFVSKPKFYKRMTVFRVEAPIWKVEAGETEFKLSTLEPKAQMLFAFDQEDLAKNGKAEVAAFTQLIPSKDGNTTVTSTQVLPICL